MAADQVFEREGGTAARFDRDIYGIRFITVAEVTHHRMVVLKATRMGIPITIILIKSDAFTTDFDAIIYFAIGQIIFFVLG